MRGEVESVMLEQLDKIELALEEQEQVITENTEEQEPVRNNGWICKFCNKLLRGCSKWILIRGFYCANIKTVASN